jgi:hypothetical protein
MEQGRSIRLLGRGSRYAGARRGLERATDHARSKQGGVAAVCDFADNLLQDYRLPWPPPPEVQKLYESRQARAFVQAALDAATARLGFHSDLQSLNSRDAITELLRPVPRRYVPVPPGSRVG